MFLKNRSCFISDDQKGLWCLYHSESGQKFIGLKYEEIAIFALGAGVPDLGWWVCRDGDSSWKKCSSLRESFIWQQRRIKNDLPSLPTKMNNNDDAVQEVTATSVPPPLPFTDEIGGPDDDELVDLGEISVSIPASKLGEDEGEQQSPLKLVHSDNEQNDVDPSVVIGEETFASVGNQTYTAVTKSGASMDDESTVRTQIVGDDTELFDNEEETRTIVEENELKEFLSEPFIDPVELEEEKSSKGGGVFTTEFVVRNHKRYAKRIPVDIECDGQKFSTHSVDISVGGINLEDPLPSWVVGYSKVRLKNKRTKQAVELTCYIVENQKPDKRHRVALLPLKNASDEEQLEAWLKVA